MQRKAQNRLWTLILMLLLCGTGLATTRVARADVSPVDPIPGAPPGDPQAGDPDDPDNSKSLPTSGSHRGSMGPTGRVITTPQQGAWGIWLLRLRMVFAATYRFMFRI